MSKYFDINFQFPESQEKEILKLNSEEKWEKLDSIFNKKNKHINFNENFFDIDEPKINYDKKISNIKNLNQKNDVKINLQHLIHPIDDEFDIFIDEKIKIFEKMKNNNKFQIKEEVDNTKQEKENFNLLISKYKKTEESIIKAKNKPIFLPNYDNKNEGKYEFNKMKNNKYFFNNSNEDNITNLGNKNKMRLNNILNKIKNEKPKNEIINNPNKFKMEKSDITNDNKENKDYFDTILEDIKKKK